MKDYVMRVIAAAIICAMAKGLLGSKTATGRLAGLLTGIIMAVTVIAPLGNISFHGVSDYWSSISEDAKEFANEGASIAEKETTNIIKSQTEAYILDKANRMGLQIAVEVELDGHSRNIPCSVVISGNISPYAQKQLQAFMEDNLGISKENQKWK